MTIEKKAGPYGMDRITFQSCGMVIYRNRNGLFDTCGRSLTIPLVSNMLREANH